MTTHPQAENDWWTHRTHSDHLNRQMSRQRPTQRPQHRHTMMIVGTSMFQSLLSPGNNTSPYLLNRGNSMFPKEPTPGSLRPTRMRESFANVLACGRVPRNRQEIWKQKCDNRVMNQPWAVTWALWRKQRATISSNRVKVSKAVRRAGIASSRHRMSNTNSYDKFSHDESCNASVHLAILVNDERDCQRTEFH
jgi:hypothetical protein